MTSREKFQTGCLAAFTISAAIAIFSKSLFVQVVAFVSGIAFGATILYDMLDDK